MVIKTIIVLMKEVYLSNMYNLPSKSNHNLQTLKHNHLFKKQEICPLVLINIKINEFCFDSVLKMCSKGYLRF